jgi:hypothetical protein
VLLALGMPLQAPDGGDFPYGTPQRPTQELIAERVLFDAPVVFPHNPSSPEVAANFYVAGEEDGLRSLFESFLIARLQPVFEG